MKSKLAGLPILAAIAFVPIGFGAVPAATSAAIAQQGGYVRIENRWQPGQFINTEHGLRAGAIQPGWHSAMWVIEDIGDGMVRIGNRWNEGHYLHVERGHLESGPIQPGWHSAMWVVEPADEGTVRFRNYYRPNQYIHVERGRLEAGAIELGWHSAMWAIRSGG